VKEISDQMEDQNKSKSVQTKILGKRTVTIPFIIRDDFNLFYMHEDNRKDLAAYLRTVKQHLFPRDTKENPVHAKNLLVKRENRSWFWHAGAWIQAEVHVTNQSKNEFELHGMAIVMVPNAFILVGTFRHNVLEQEKHYYMLSAIGTKE
jgi:hypothetical protein